jgi:hypothetical protein
MEMFVQKMDGKTSERLEAQDLHITAFLERLDTMEDMLVKMEEKVEQNENNIDETIKKIMEFKSKTMYDVSNIK